MGDYRSDEDVYWDAFDEYDAADGRQTDNHPSVRPALVSANCRRVTHMPAPDMTPSDGNCER